VLQNLFAWLRSSVRDAVLGGVADALEVIDGNDASTAGNSNHASMPAPSLEAIRRRLQPALTGPAATNASTTPASVAGLPQDEPTDQTALTTNHRTNGRRHKATATAD
jgi:hypothetical protein